MNVQIDRQVTKLRKLQNQSNIDRSRWARYTEQQWRLVIQRLEFLTPKSASDILDELHASNYYELNISTIRNILYLLSRDMFNEVQKTGLWTDAHRIVTHVASNGRYKKYSWEIRPEWRAACRATI